MLTQEIAQNYRHAYRRTYGEEFPHDDVRLAEIVEEVGVLSSSEETDAWVLADMFCASVGITTHSGHIKTVFALT